VYKLPNDEWSLEAPVLRIATTSHDGERCGDRKLKIRVI
jgi:hypothetical protein